MKLAGWMRPRRTLSLRARLVASAAIFVLVAILVVGLVLNIVLDRVVRAEIAGRLDLQISSIRSEILVTRPRGPREEGREGRREARLASALEAGRLNGPPFDREGSGWYWQVASSDEVIARSRSLDNDEIEFEPFERGRREEGGPNPRSRRPPHDLAIAQGEDGQRLLLRQSRIEAGGRTYAILATAPLAALQNPLRSATLAVGAALALLGTALVIAILVQVRFGLAPIEGLRRRLGQVRQGEASRIEGEPPLELKPLVGELNALIEQDAVNLRQARLHVANLAHGLKTPLATLSAMAERLPESADRGDLLNVAGLMDRRIRHHLRRAQTAAIAGSARRRTDLAAEIADMANMLRRFHAGSPVEIVVEGEGPLFVAVDAEDLDEMLGNLLDNAFRHARTRIVLSFEQDGREARVRVADDGPGLKEEEIAIVRQAGRRLDESEPGHGFGLPITIEIAELYGGRLDLERASEGGLEARLLLPVAGAPVS